MQWCEVPPICCDSHSVGSTIKHARATGRGARTYPQVHPHAHRADGVREGLPGALG